MTFIETILKIGSLAGLLSFIWLFSKDIIQFLTKPKLKILELDEKRDIRIFKYDDSGWIRKFGNCYVYSKRKMSRRCIAKLTFYEFPENVKHLERSYNLHWSDIDYSMRTTEAQPIDLGEDERRLDIVFTQKDVGREGAWIAVPMALSKPISANQAYLPVGVYKVEILISSENGRSDSQKYEIISPKNWEDLQLRKLN